MRTGIMLIISTLLKATFDSLNFILDNDAGCIETSSSTYSNIYLVISFPFDDPCPPQAIPSAFC